MEKDKNRFKICVELPTRKILFSSCRKNCYPVCMIFNYMFFTQYYFLVLTNLRIGNIDK